MGFDIAIRNGLVVDGTGSPPRPADIGIAGERVVAVADRGQHLGADARHEIDASDRIVTPGFVDIHTHLDAQLAWDPLGTSSCWHGVTSVVLGNCGVTFAPCRPEDRSHLAELMESVEDIPRAAILEGMSWDWVTYGEYLASLDRLPKGPNVGGMIGHCAVRHHVMGDRSLGEEAPTDEDMGAMVELVEEAMDAGALGFSTSRTLMNRVPDGRPMPGTWAEPDELFAFADVLGRHGRGVFESASRLGERDSDDLTNTRAELAWMGEVSRRSGRPVTFGLAQSDRRPELFRQVVDLAKEQNAIGGCVRPQTTARSLGLLFGLQSRTPFDRSPAWRELRGLSVQEQLLALRDPARRTLFIAQAEEYPPGIDLSKLYVLPPGPARYDCDADTSLAAHAAARGVSEAAAFIELAIETGGTFVCNLPLLNQQLAAVEELLDDPLVTLGLADSGAHVGRFTDASQPTFFLTYWVRERARWRLEDAVRRLTLDAASLFGLTDRGVLRPGAYADVNVIDIEGLTLPQPEFIHDFPGGAGRYVQGSSGYDWTIVNGQVFMDHGEHAGALPGRLLRSTD
jgi:N-acyl-D-aspartate/D-glutamate deacylase